MAGFQIYKLHLKSMFFKNYCYIIVDKKTNLAAIIDPAWELGAIESLLEKINASLAVILLTHSHFDHTNLVEPLLMKYHPQVIMSMKEIEYYNFRCDNLIAIEHGDNLKLGDTMIECILTPGHTVGSACFLLPDSLFTGDTIFIEGCGVCDTIGGDPEEMFYSIQMIKNTISPDVLVYPSHCYGKLPGYPLNYLLKENIYFQIEKLEHFVAFRMRENQKDLLDFQ